MDKYLILAVLGTTWTCIAMLYAILKFRAPRDEETKDPETRKRRGTRSYITAGVLVGLPIIIVVLLWVFRPPVPGAGIAYIMEYPEQITIGQHYTLNGNVNLEHVPQGWELWAIKKGSNEYWPTHIIDVSRGSWSISFNDGDGSYMTEDVEFRMVIGLAHPDISDKWQQWADNAAETGNWAGIIYTEIPLTDYSLWSPQDSVKLLRPMRCIEVQHEDKCIKYSGE